MTEAELMDATVSLAHVYNWKVAHFRPAQTAKGWRTPVGADGKGFVDLVLAKVGHDPMFVELKSATGKLRQAQIEWIAALWRNVHVWTPAEWSDGTILRVLSGIQENQK